MKLVDIRCPHCGATVKIDPTNKNATCEYCGSVLLVADEPQHIQYDNAEEAGYKFEKGRQRAQAEARRNMTRANVQTYRQLPRKKRKTWLWILGWICIFPLPLTVLLLRKKDMRPALKYGIIAASWIIYLLIGLFGGTDDSGKNSTELSHTPVVVESSQMEEDSQIEEEQNTAEKGISTETVQPEAAESAEEEQEPNTASDMETGEVKPIGDHYDEALNGRGIADSGRNEPDYINVIGYVAISSSQALNIKKTDSFQDESLWIVPTYERDKQFWNENGYLPHKTEVVVREQILEHGGYGAYSGYLLVEKTDDHSMYYIDVNNFITKPYWNYQDDLVLAARIGDFVAEYKQVSDYYPVDNSGDKLEIPDGTIVLVTGVTGTSNRVNRNENEIEAIVWKEWRNGYGGVQCHFNKSDLTIVY